MRVRKADVSNTDALCDMLVVHAHFSHREVPALWGPLARFLLESRSLRGCNVTGITLPTWKAKQPGQPSLILAEGWRTEQNKFTGWAPRLSLAS